MFLTQLGIAIYIYHHFNKKEHKESKDSSSDIRDVEGSNVLSSHFLGDKNTGSILLLLTTFSTTFSGYTMVGVPEQAYLNGFLGLAWLPWIYIYSFYHRGNAEIEGPSRDSWIPEPY